MLTSHDEYGLVISEVPGVSLIYKVLTSNHKVVEWTIFSFESLNE